MAGATVPLRPAASGIHDARTSDHAGRGTTHLEILDPTAEREPGDRPLAAPLPTRQGARIALLDIRKPRGDVFLDAVERELVRLGHEVRRTAKPTFTRPAPQDLRREIAEHCDAVIEALAD